MSLHTCGGITLSETVAIIEYLNETRGLGLLPNDQTEAAKVRALSYAIAMEIHPVCNIGVAKFAAEKTDAITLPDWMQHFIGPGLTAFEALLEDPATGRFCHGDTPGLADCCLIPQLYNAQRWDVDLSGWPRINAIADACAALGAFAAAHPDEVRPTPPA